MKSGLVLLMIVLAGMQGCGSLIHGTKQDLEINTVPPGTRATIGSETCVTPCNMTVKRDSQSIRIDQGSRSQTFDIERDFNTGTTIIGNILWLLPGAIIDIVSGGAWEIRPVNLQLSGETTDPTAPTPTPAPAPSNQQAKEFNMRE
jgi:hypothetical protein